MRPSPAYAGGVELAGPQASRLMKFATFSPSLLAEKRTSLD